MKLWRKLSMTNGKGSGKRIKRAHSMQEYIFKNSARTYPLLTALLGRAGVTVNQDNSVVQLEAAIADAAANMEKINEAQ